MAAADGLSLDEVNKRRARGGLDPLENFDSLNASRATAGLPPFDSSGHSAEPADKRPPTRQTRRAAAARGASAISSGARTSAGETSGILHGKTPSTLSGAVIGLIGYALLSNFIAGGFPQVKGWFASKFLNKPYTVNVAANAGPTLTPISPPISLSGTSLVPPSGIPSPVGAMQ